MGEVYDGVVLIGGAKAHAAVHESHRRPQAAVYLRRIRTGQDADDLSGQLRVGVCGARIQASSVYHLHGRRLGGLIQGTVGHVVAVGGEDTDGTVFLRQAQLLRQGLRNVGNGMRGQNIAFQQIACHALTPLARSMPLAFFSSMVLISSAMCAPASTAVVPWRWILEMTVRLDSGMPM